MYSAKKPYLKLKSSVVDFFKSPTMFFKQFRSKFSQFEKPYLVDEYKQMHLEWPRWDWGPWDWKPWNLPPKGPFQGLPEYEPGKNAFGTPPERDKLSCTQDGCFVLEWPPFYVEPGEFYRLHASIRANAVVDVIIEGPVIFPNDCIEHVPPGWPLCGFYCGGWMQVSKDAENGNAISITFVTVGGGTCCYTGEVKTACNPIAVIQYTTLQMAIDETQTLTASEPGEAYTWAISSGGGSLSESEGNSTVYTAPSTNANCAANPTIQLSCDGEIIDSITIAVNAFTAENPACSIIGDCYEHIGFHTKKYYYTCWDAYLYNTMYCTANSMEDCIATCHPGVVKDERDQNMKNQGCCPACLL